MITVCGRATSSNVQVVMWGIAELGLEYERLDFGHVHGGLDTPEYLAMNPHGKVPVIRDGDLAVWESCAILRYLASRYGKAPFWPGDPALRAPVDMWAEWAKTTLGPAFTVPIFWPVVRNPAPQRDEAALAHALARFDGLLGMLEAQIGDHPWIMGAHFTLADIVAGHLFYRYFTMDIPRVDRPGISNYYDRLIARPAYREHVMVSFDVLRASPP
jgi:glutathione S-transferase